MKLNELRSLGHNMAHSFASGASLLTGMFGYDVFEDVRKSPQNCIEVEFVSGTYAGLTSDTNLQAVLDKFANELPKLSARHNIPANQIGEIKAKFFVFGIERLFEVTVVARDGRSATDLYKGHGGARVRTVNQRGRVVKKSTVFSTDVS